MIDFGKASIQAGWTETEEQRQQRQRAERARKSSVFQDLEPDSSIGRRQVFLTSGSGLFGGGEPPPPSPPSEHEQRLQKLPKAIRELPGSLSIEARELLAAVSAEYDRTGGRPVQMDQWIAANVLKTTTEKARKVIDELIFNDRLRRVTSALGTLGYRPSL